MKLDLGPLKPYSKPTFAPTLSPGEDEQINRHVTRPIVVGSIIVGVFVVGMLIWFALAPLSSAIQAPGALRVESNVQVIRHREGGMVRSINVREGQRVRRGQILLQMDDVQPRAALDVMQNQYDTFQAQSARYLAESTARGAVVFPPELTSRMADPRVADLVRNEQFLFTSRLAAFQSQNSVLQQRVEQLETQIGGVQAQIAAVNENISLTREELTGYEKLNAQGYAPKTLILRYQRSLADLQGRKGALQAEMSRLREQIGETRLQLTTVRNERISQAAEGLRQAQAALAEVSPKLTATRQTFEHAQVRSPADGYVLGLTQHTVGGVVGSGELLMNVVPANAPLIVQARIRPQDVDDVHAGMKAKVHLSAFNQRKVDPVDGEVFSVSADRLTDEQTGMGYFMVEVRIPPKELKSLPKGVALTPGMPADVAIQTGTRSILDYIVSPLTDTIEDALKEE
jgi:HlyD family secretion protein